MFNTEFSSSRRLFLRNTAATVGGLVIASQLGTQGVEASGNCTQSGVNVPCTESDGISRIARAHLNRVVRDPQGNNFAISDASMVAYILKPIGTSDYPMLDLQNPILGSDGMPKAFNDTKYPGLVREVQDAVVFKAAKPGTAEFNGRLINSRTGKDFLEITRTGAEIKDRAMGIVKSTKQCGLNCTEIVVFGRGTNGSDFRPFRDKLDSQLALFQSAVWSFPQGEDPGMHELTSFALATEAQIAQLRNSGQIAPAIAILTED